MENKGLHRYRFGGPYTMDYTGIKCPVCEKTFTKQDDVVVCPECGAPYHRECYQKEGHCIFEEKHQKGESWQPPQERKENASTEEETRRCPRCGKENSRYSLFCDHCGMSLSDDPPVGPQNNYGQFRDAPPRQGPGVPRQGTSPNQAPTGFPQGSFFGGGPFVLDPMGGVNPSEPIDDVPAGEVAKLVQNNTTYYLPVFMNYKRNHRNRFNFCAFFCTGGWFLYRKQYKWGTILTAIMILIYGFSTYFSYASQDILLNLMSQAGFSDSMSLLSMGQPYDKLRELLFQQSFWTQITIFLPHILGLLQFVVMIIVGFNANKMYLKHCVRKIRRIHELCPAPEERAVQLQNQGGVNTAIAVCMLICYMILSFLPNLFI